MHGPKAIVCATIVACLSLGFLSGCPEVAGLQGPPGPQGEPGPPGASGAMGTLTGTVTNGLTGNGVGGVSCELDPPYDGAQIMTAEDGTFSEELPTGIYTITFQEDRFESLSLNVAVLGGDIETADVALMPIEPVIVTATVDGDLIPGATLNAMMVVDALDGSTVEGVAWTVASTAAATIDRTDAELATVTLGDDRAFKDRLLHVLAEPPISESDLPSTVELPEGEFPGGLQSRFQIVGINPFALEQAARVTLTATVTTSSGTYVGEVDIHTQLEWKPSPGIHNVPVGIPVLLQGRRHVDDDGDGFNDATGADVAAYDWELTTPSGSSAMLMDATTQNPYFTPDASGLYSLTVTDTTRDPGDETVLLEIYAGTWKGVITGQDENGRPEAANCTGCHNGVIAPDQFTPWAQTGHAEIFTNNLNTSTHYGEQCFACHTVGFDPGVGNGGIDESGDYADFLSAELVNHPGDNWPTVLRDLPDTARMANIQCENCHGPQDGGAHQQGEPRVDISSDVCAVCHGEPLRHARFQQWQISGHANYELAEDQGESGNCSRCHTGNGFLAWLPVLLDDDPATDPLDDITVTWTTDQTHPQTCVTCHDPHAVGTTTGVETDATVRIAGNTPPLIAGFQALGVGNGAICMTCHNSRRGLRNDSTFAEFVGTSEAARAPHGSAQTDMLMGQNAYFVEVGIRGNHSLIQDTCVNCHMEQTSPPDLLAYQSGGTNHAFAASSTICSNCHGEAFDAVGLQTAFDATSEALQRLIEDALLGLMADQFALGNTLDLNGEALLTDVDDIDDLEFEEYHGRQSMTLTMADGTIAGPYRMTDITVLDPTAAELGALYDFADARLAKAGWNWNLANNDGSRGVHNPSFAFGMMDAAIDELK